MDTLNIHQVRLEDTTTDKQITCVGGPFNKRACNIAVTSFEEDRVRCVRINLNPAQLHELRVWIEQRENEYWASKAVEKEETDE
jgi:hypothetical protein